MNKVIAMILAGGQGSRLSVLAEHRAKPAVPFGGIYRIIDFTMSNVMRSQIPTLGVLTQYKPYSLMDHISTGSAWGFVGRKHQAKILPPYTGEMDSDWYGGTADAVYQNLNFIERFNAEQVLVLSGDHIYNMDYRELIDFHREKNADLTIAMQEVPWEEVHRFGVAVLDDDQRMVDFIEKSKDAPSNIASLGIYIFNSEFLEDILVEDAADKESDHDFGKNVIPTVMKTARVYCHVFKGYWRDVGTIDAYWRTHQEILDPKKTGLDLEDWKLRTNIDLENVHKLTPTKIASSARVRHSIISPGCVIEGEVVDSILSPGVHVKPGARVEKSVVLHFSEIGENSSVTFSILDKRVKIGKECKVGVGDPEPNRAAPHLLSSGITVFGKKASLPAGFTMGKNCLVQPMVDEDDYPAENVDSGETVKAKVPLWPRRNKK